MASFIIGTSRCLSTSRTSSSILLLYKYKYIYINILLVYPVPRPPDLQNLKGKELQVVGQVKEIRGATRGGPNLVFFLMMEQSRWIYIYIYIENRGRGSESLHNGQEGAWSPDVSTSAFCWAVKAGFVLLSEKRFLKIAGLPLRSPSSPLLSEWQILTRPCVTLLAPFCPVSREGAARPNRWLLHY